MERLCTMGIAGLMAALICGATVPAQEQTRLPPDPEAKQSKSNPAPPPNEDEQLLKDLAVLERLELLKNLELFEEPKEPDSGQQQQQ